MLRHAATVAALASVALLGAILLSGQPTQQGCIKPTAFPPTWYGNCK